MIPCFVFRCSCSCTVAEKSTGRGWLWLLLISVATQNVPPLHNEASGVTKLLNGGGIHRHIGNTCARITQTGLSPQIFHTWFMDRMQGVKFSFWKGDFVVIFFNWYCFGENIFARHPEHWTSWLLNCSKYCIIVQFLHRSCFDEMATMT